MYTQKDVLDTV